MPEKHEFASRGAWKRSLGVSPAFGSRLRKLQALLNRIVSGRRRCRNGLQAQYFLARPRPERDAVGAGKKLGGRKLREQRDASARLEGCSRWGPSTAHVRRLDPEPEGHGAVVGEADEHMGTEAAARNPRMYLGGACEEMREQAFARLLG